MIKSNLFKFRNLSCRSYATADQSSIVLKHELPSEQRNRKYFLAKSKIDEAKALIKENPVEWTPTKLAKKFDVSVPIIQAHVSLPSKSLIRVCFSSISSYSFEKTFFYSFPFPFSSIFSHLPRIFDKLIKI